MLNANRIARNDNNFILNVFKIIKIIICLYCGWPCNDLKNVAWDEHKSTCLYCQFDIIQFYFEIFLNFLQCAKID